MASLGLGEHSVPNFAIVMFDPLVALPRMAVVNFNRLDDLQALLGGGPSASLREFPASGGREGHPPSTGAAVREWFTSEGGVHKDMPFVILGKFLVASFAPLGSALVRQSIRAHHGIAASAVPPAGCMSPVVLKSAVGGAVNVGGDWWQPGLSGLLGKFFNFGDARPQREKGRNNLGCGKGVLSLGFLVLEYTGFSFRL